MSSLVVGSTTLAAHSLSWKFHLSSGPGGTNASKVATAVELRLEVNEANLRPDVVSRLREIARSRINLRDELVIQANKHRTQDRNRRAALDRLATLLDRAQEKPKVRIATRPTGASKRARLNQKRRQSEKKQSRRFRSTDLD
ncbi:MAG: alternative ribosome rescue aminoacyl-tRNA hydrolase ArfB [Gammaproteobacteria bacterium]|nr:alternative ribosome rescue aminoacyl-tRNA hydrolase ArfB [Gammaproteobacteria bacterium]